MFCPECGFEKLVETSEPLTENFKGEKITVYNITRYECPHCHEYVISADQGKKMTEQLHSQYRKRLGLLSPEEIKGIRKKYGWTQADFEKVLGVTFPTVSRWESGRVIQAKPVDTLMRVIDNYRNVAEKLAHKAEVKMSSKNFSYKTSTIIGKQAKNTIKELESRQWQKTNQLPSWSIAQ